MLMLPLGKLIPCLRHLLRLGIHRQPFKANVCPDVREVDYTVEARKGIIRKLEMALIGVVEHLPLPCLSPTDPKQDAPCLHIRLRLLWAARLAF